MKYTIEGFNQEKAIELGLDLTDLLILRWIIDFSPKMSKKIIDDKEYFWVKYQALLEDIPIIDVKDRALRYRLKKLVDKDVLEHKTVKKDGTFSFYTFGNKYIELIKEMQPIAEGLATNCREGRQPIAEQNNPSTKYNKSTKYIYYGEYKNVFFTEEQYNKLLIEFPLDYQDRIQRLDDYMQSTGTKYKDCLATIRVWAKRDKTKPNKQSNPIEEMNRLLREEEAKCK